MIETGGLRERPWAHRPPAITDHRHRASPLPDLADEVAGLRAGTTVEIDVDRPRQRTWMTRDGDVRSGIQYRGLAVRVVEPSSRSGVVRSILAAEPAADVLG